MGNTQCNETQCNETLVVMHHIGKSIVSTAYVAKLIRMKLRSKKTEKEKNEH